jgi:hypothetical protein
MADFVNLTRLPRFTHMHDFSKFLLGAKSTWTKDAAEDP